jgi:SAM-dependent methyltransferase
VVTPPRLVGVSELMDRPDVDPAQLAHTLSDLARVNRAFGGTGVVLRYLTRWLTAARTPVRVLDVGTGFADIPRALVEWARRCGLSLSIEALERHPATRQLAAQASQGYPEIHVQAGDALALPYATGSFDVAFASQVLHHLEGDAPVRMLRELRRVAAHVLVGDLRRGTVPYLLTWAALRIVSTSPLIRHDGPLSIRRGFLPGELRTLARAAGWRAPRVTRHACFRLALADTA